MQNTRVKICGITRPEDAALAAELGADAIGINLMTGPRRISVNDAVEILRTLPPFVTNVVLQFIDEHITEAYVKDRAIWPELLADFSQLYGISESWAENLAIKHPTVANRVIKRTKWILPLPVENRQSIADLRHSLDCRRILPAALLLDTASPKLGGTGQPFNWNWIAEARDAGELENLPPLILAGGLTPDNVAEAIRIAQPYAVDVSSGVEVAGKPGIKDPIKMRDFIQAAKSAT